MPVDLNAWIANARPGERIIYHCGHLSHLKSDDRRRDPWALEMRAVCDTAWQLSRAGLVSLVQRKNGTDDYDYIAERTRQGFRP